jgi:multiple sugar transport system permease protein
VAAALRRLVFALFPFYWMAITSLKSNQELYSRKVMPLIVHHPTLKHYVDLLTETSFLNGPGTPSWSR